MAVSEFQSSFNAGEISPELYGQVSLKKFSAAATTLRNAFPNYRGGALSRGGLAFVGRCKQKTGAQGGSIASGSIFFPGNPSPGDTVTFNGVIFTFVASGGSGTNINIGFNAGGTIFANLLPVLQGSSNPLLAVATYNGSGGPSTATVTITYGSLGAIGNSYTLAASAATPSGPTLTGGSDPSGTLGPPRPVTFQFSITQGYILEMGDNYMRFVFQGGYVLENPVSISGVTRANPAEVFVSGTPFANGDWVYGQGIGGMTELNGNTYIVAGAASGHFTLEDLNGNPVDSSTYTAYTSGGTFSRLYTIATPYLASDLPYLKTSQTADVMQMTLSNPISGNEYPPQTLTRLAASNWTLVATDFDSVITAPTNVAAVANAAAPSSGINATFAYVVTAVDSSGNESIASAVVTCNGADIEVEGGSNTITWDTVTGAQLYNIYRSPASVDQSGGPLAPPAGSFMGLVGSAFANSYSDTQPAPDYTQTPPTHGDPFAPGQILAVDITGGGSGISGLGYSITTSTGSDFAGTPLVNGGILGGFINDDNGKLYAQTDTISFTGSGSLPTATLDVGPESGTYPGVCAYFQQRLMYADSLNNPDTIWGSQTARFSNFDVSIPTIPTDAITASPWTEQVNGIQWLIAMPGGLIAMTGLRAWQIIGEGSYQLNVQPITPSTTQAQPQAFNGCSATIQPIVIDYDVVYVQAVGNSTVFDLSWNFWVNIYTGNDLTILSSHLFFDRSIVQWAWSRQPYKVLWACCDDGTMLSLTYLKEQEVYGWARHDTFYGLVVGISSVSEPPVNAIYAVVQRPSTYFAFGIYTMERMDNRIWKSVEDTFALDSAVSNPMTFPDTPLTANGETGAVVFTAVLPIFSPATVGKIIRMAGGIATITTYFNTGQVGGTWNLGASAGSLGIPFAAAGDWSISTPVDALTASHLYGGPSLSGLADGVPISGLTVAIDGTVVLPFFASNVSVGLTMTAQIQSPYMNGQEVVQGARKMIPAATVRVAASGPFQFGTNQPDGAAQNPPQLAPAWSNMTETNFQNMTGGQTAPITYTSPGGQTVQQVFTGDFRVVGTGALWNSKGQVAIQQTLPLPLELLAIIPETLPGDIPEVAYKPQQGPAGPQGQRIARGPGLWQLR